jgi:hypothetical protein
LLIVRSGSPACGITVTTQARKAAARSGAAFLIPLTVSMTFFRTVPGSVQFVRSIISENVLFFNSKNRNTLRNQNNAQRACERSGRGAHRLEFYYCSRLDPAKRILKSVIELDRKSSI